MSFKVSYPKIGRFSTPQNWSETLNTINKLKPEIEALAEAAFVDENCKAWMQAQQLLFHINTKDFDRKENQTDFVATVNIAIRNILLTKQYEILNLKEPVILDCYNTFTKEAAVQELHDKARSHRINSHPFLVHMSEEGLSKSMALKFIENWNTDSNIFHLYIAALSIHTPFILRGELYHNLYEELGEGNIEQAHPTIFQKNFKNLNQSESFTPLTSSLNMFNTQVYYVSLCGNYRKGLGGLGFIELNVPVQMQMIYDGLLKSGLPDADLVFWPLHIELDTEHGLAWFDEMTKIIETADDAKAILEGGVRVLDARASLFDALWDELNLAKVA